MCGLHQTIVELSCACGYGLNEEYALSAKRYFLNAFIALVVAVIAIDTLPQSPGAIRRGLTPVLTRLGVNQGYWDLFAPEPDRANTRI